MKEIEEDEERSDDEQNKEFKVPSDRLAVVHQKSGQKLPHRSDLGINAPIDTDYYMLCFTSYYHEYMYDLFKNADACLIIRDRVSFTKRLLAETHRILPGWGAVNADVVYGRLRHDYGAPFMKSEKYSFQWEWRYVWLPRKPIEELESFNVYLGSIEDIAGIEFSN